MKKTPDAESIQINAGMLPSKQRGKAHLNLCWKSNVKEFCKYDFYFGINFNLNH